MCSIRCCFLHTAWHVGVKHRRYISLQTRRCAAACANCNTVDATAPTCFYLLGVHCVCRAANPSCSTVAPAAVAAAVEQYCSYHTHHSNSGISSRFPMSKGKPKSSNSGRKRLLKWLDSFEQVSLAMDKHGNLMELLKAGGGICQIENFLPTTVADGVHDMLEQLSEAEWNVTAADDDYTHNNISHEFLSTKSQTLEAVFRVFTLLLPDSLFTFSAAKYCRAGHIKPHDDRAYTQVCMDDGSIQLCSRNVAVIYYLTKDWAADDGGLLIDHEAAGGPHTYIPKYNSVISFTIPRWHEVTPVTGHKPRYSIFGWFLEPGKLYDLQLDAKMPSQEQLQLRHKQEKRSGAAAAGEEEGGVQASPAAAVTKKRRKSKQQRLDGASQQQQQQAKVVLPSLLLPQQQQQPGTAPKRAKKRPRQGGASKCSSH